MLLLRNTRYYATLDLRHGADIVAGFPSKKRRQRAPGQNVNGYSGRRRARRRIGTFPYGRHAFAARRSRPSRSVQSHKRSTR
jgi:hypothetical protein